MGGEGFLHIMYAPISDGSVTFVKLMRKCLGDFLKSFFEVFFYKFLVGFKVQLIQII